MGLHGCQDGFDLQDELVITVWFHGAVLQSQWELRWWSSDRDRTSGNRRRSGSDGAPLALVVLRFPSAAKGRQSQKFKKLRALCSGRSRTPSFPFLLLERRSSAARTHGRARRLLVGNLGFGGVLRGFDLKKRKHPVAPRATELRLQKIILEPRNRTKDVVGKTLYLRGINLCKLKTAVLRSSLKKIMFFLKSEDFAEVGHRKPVNFLLRRSPGGHGPALTGKHPQATNSLVRSRMLSTFDTP
jgi:hypothetical protein